MLHLIVARESKKCIQPGQICVCFFAVSTCLQQRQQLQQQLQEQQQSRVQQSRVNINKKPAKLLSHETRRQATYACPVGTAQRAGPGSGQRRQQAAGRQTAADKTRRAKDKTSRRRRQSIACASAYSNLRLIILCSLQSQSSADANESGKTNALPRHMAYPCHVRAFEEHMCMSVSRLAYACCLPPSLPTPLSPQPDCSSVRKTMQFFRTFCMLARL